jgi:hypothetical protein
MAKPKRLLEPSEDSPGSHHTPSIGQSEVLSFAGGRPPRAPDAQSFVDRILEHYKRGEGFGHYHLPPDDHRGPDDEYERDYYDQARLLDLITRIVRAAAPSPRFSAENPTIRVLDDLIARGVVTNPTLIADVLSANAHLLLIGGDAYVTGLGWPRLSILRTAEHLEPVFQQPAVRVSGLTPEYVLVPGYREWEIVYFRSAPQEPEGRVPAYPVALAAACALRQCLPYTMYSWTSGKRMDWALDRARIRPRPNSREFLFDPVRFWRWRHTHQRD